MANGIIVVGMGYGDEGKGTITDFLAADTKAKLVVKYSGGYQAAHNVHANGKSHTFSQFGSGSLLGVPTFLDKNFIVSAEELANEADHLYFDCGIKNTLDLMSIHPECPIATPYDREHNRKVRQGNTCGLGIAEVRQRELDGISLRVKHLRTGESLNILKAIKNYFNSDLPLPDVYMRIVNLSIWKQAIPDVMPDGTIIFEGSQGVLLDEIHGEEGFNTWSNTTSQHAEEFCRLYNIPYEICGVIRTYHTRHGAGPFNESTDPKFLQFAEQDDNKLNDWQGNFKVGPFNKDLWEKACSIQKFDYLAVTCRDQDEGITNLMSGFNIPSRISSFGKDRNSKSVRKKTYAS